ncbi:MAG TPA: flagellar motor switch protein FliG [Terriglobales bacterium]|nr:flagellar motor switch protein FliG [Terriglobales bacterium]
MSASARMAMTGSRKAAILIALMTEEVACSVLRQLPETDIHLVTRELSEIGQVSPEMAHDVLEECDRALGSQKSLTRGGSDIALRLLVTAFGEEQAKGVMKKVAALQGSSTAHLESLKKVDPAQLARFIEAEHPQTIALVLAHLDEKQVAAVLMRLPEQVRSEAVKRLAQLRQFSPEIAETVSGVLSRKLQALGEQNRKTYAGFKSVADVMNRLDPAVAKTILESLEHEDANLAINIRNFMFTFEDLLGVADVAIREWLGAIDKKVLAMCLKGASSDLKDHIFRSMSSRASEMLKEDIEALGPVRSKDVTQAQREAVEVLRRLESEGKVVLRAEGDDEYVV